MRMKFFYIESRKGSTLLTTGVACGHVEAEIRKNDESSRDRSGNTFLRNEKKIAANSTILMLNKAKKPMLLKMEIGNFMLCKQQIFLK